MYEVTLNSYGGRYAIPIIDTSGVIITVNGINPKNAYEYEFRVIENKTKVVVPWTRPKLFTKFYFVSSIAEPPKIDEIIAYLGDIIRCESSNAYTEFFLADGKSIMVSRPIFEYEELLTNYDFIRCHQSHLVNKKFIKSLIKKDSGHLLLDDDARIPISRSKKENVLKALHTIKNKLNTS